MRTDFRPLCDKHYRPMTPVQLIGQIGTEAYSILAFACSERGCARHYNIIHGYFTISSGQIEPKTKTIIGCQNDESPMYLAEFEPQGSVRTWSCAQFGCGGGKTTRGPVQ